MQNYLREIEKKAETLGLSIHGLFIGAGVSYSNWARWQGGATSPTLATLNKLLDHKPRAAKAKTKAKRARAA